MATVLSESIPQAAMNILLIDHECHRRTKSADFFCQLLKSDHNVDVFYYGRHYDCKLPKAKIDWADVIVFWEFIPFRFRLGVTGKPCVFVPMYDNEWASVGFWKRLALLGMNVISFSERVTKHAKRCGIENIVSVKYAPSPDEIHLESGNPRVAALWERGTVSFKVIKKLFKPEQVDKVILMRRTEENIQYAPISQEDMCSYKVEIHEGGFLPEEEYRKILEEPGVYIAPRLKEGIGMSFLEQMAMGKCVIAHNDSTMDEYIKDGDNGILVDMRNPHPIESEEICVVRSNARKSIAALYERWERDKKDVLRFFSKLDASKRLHSPWSLRSVLLYAWYFIEGAVFRIKGLRMMFWAAK